MSTTEHNEGITVVVRFPGQSPETYRNVQAFAFVVSKPGGISVAVEASSMPPAVWARTLRGLADDVTPSEVTR